MTKKIEIFQIDAFTTEPFRGNPAGVVYSDELNQEEKQLIAREMNLSETAFLSKSERADFRLQWFTPTNEVKLCGHATIASLHFLKEIKSVSDNQVISFETLSGILKCSFNESKYLMQIPSQILDEFTGCKEEILSALCLDRNDVSDLPFILNKDGYLFICVNSLKSLWNIRPDFKILKQLSEDKREFFDVAVFSMETVEKNSSAHIRFFAPFHGINEDPVTGSACGPMLAVLQKINLLNNYKLDSFIVIEQGDILDRKGRVFVKISSRGNELYIAGNAVTVLKGNLTF